MTRLRRPIFRMLLLTFMVIVSCRDRGDLDDSVSAAAPSRPVRSRVDANWPGMGYSEVRAYYYRQAGTLMDAILDESALKRVVTDGDGVLLTTNQTGRLLTAFTATHKPYEPLLCVDARHAFILYDSLHHAVAAIEVGFDCRSVIMTPGGMQKQADLPAVADLVSELGLPIHPSGTSAAEFRKRFEAAVDEDSADMSKAHE